MTQPFFSSRKWIKVWINEWREGTLRWQASDFQRAFWIDLLALAGRSRYPGVVCAGRDGDKIIGYPAAFLAPNSAITTDNIEETLNLFNSKDMLTYETSTSVQGHTLYAITITNWKKYQSDYEANKGYQKTYRDKKKASSPSMNGLTSQLDERKTLEREVELDLDKDKEKKASAATPNGARPVFSSFAFTINQAQDLKLADTYPWVDRQQEYRKIDLWLTANRTGRKVKNPLAFTQNWFNKVPCPATQNGRSKANERIERGQQALENVFGHRSGLADNLRSGVSGGSNREPRLGLPNNTRRDSPGHPAQGVLASHEDIEIPPAAGGHKGSR